MKNFLFVFIGGGLGSCLRYLMSLAFGKVGGLTFPTSTFLVNMAGCLAIGIMAGFIFKYKLDQVYVLLFITGILGGFTTFSSFALEFVQLIKNNQTGIALLYAVLTNFVGSALAALGLYCIK